MLSVILNRLLIEIEDIKRKTDSGIEIAYGERESRHLASVTQGVVLSIGPDAFKDWGYAQDGPVKVGDKVQFAKYAPAPVADPDDPANARLVVINDEDVIAIIKSKEKTNE